MNKKLKGFTIAELLISLLIISLVLSAAIPTITRKKAGNETIWQWSESPNSAFFGVGANQSAIIGNTYKTTGDAMQNFDDDTNSTISSFSNDLDKLLITKKADTLQSSHISFYNIVGDTSFGVKYTGRLVLDSSNVALGIGTLYKNNTSTCTSGGNCTSFGNTAIGQNALVLNEDGSYNTAIGSKSLTLSKTSYNTAVGSYASSDSEGSYSQWNTAVGAFALKQNKYSLGNTAVGFMALNSVVGTDSTPDFTSSTPPSNGGMNTAIGTGACSSATGSGNICIGYGAGSYGLSSTNLPTRYGINDASNNMLYIGSTSIPLVIGRLEKYNDDNVAHSKRMFGLNTQHFDINTPMADYNVLKVSSAPQASLVTSEFNHIPYQTSAGVSRQFRITANETSGLFINSHKYTAVNTEIDKYGTLSLNGGRLLISEDDNGTTSINSGNGTDKTLGNYKINLTKDNISLFGKGTDERNLVFKVDGNDVNLSSTGDFIKFATKAKFLGDLVVDSSNVYFNSSIVNFNVNAGTENGAVNFSVPVTFNQNITITGGDTIFNNDPKITGLSSIGGGEGFTSPSNNSIKDGMVTLWSAIYTLNRKINGILSSDARLKNISGDNTAGLKEINALKVKNFTYKNDKEKTPHVGVIAQELQKVFPNSVKEGEDGYLRIRTEEIFYAMVNSIKELFVKIQDLTAKVTGLDDRLKKLEQENTQLKKQNAEFEKRLKKLEAKAN